jgi:hypothetical protein
VRAALVTAATLTVISRVGASQYGLESDVAPLLGGLELFSALGGELVPDQPHMVENCGRRVVQVLDEGLVEKA